MRVEIRTDASTSGKYDLSERGDYFAYEFDMSTRGSDTTGRDSEQDESEEEEKDRKDEKRRVMKEQAEEFLRAAPEGTSARVRELMEKLARGGRNLRIRRTVRRRRNPMTTWTNGRQRPRWRRR